MELKRPGHDQCKVCHADDFDKDIKQIICAQCHGEFPPDGASDVLPFPRYKSTRAILFQFSHHQHVDQKARSIRRRGSARIAPSATSSTSRASSPGSRDMPQCAACHSKPGMQPALNASLDAAGCRGCHTPGGNREPRVH